MEFEKCDKTKTFTQINEKKHFKIYCAIPDLMSNIKSPSYQDVRTFSLVINLTFRAVFQK